MHYITSDKYFDYIVAPIDNILNFECLRERIVRGCLSDIRYRAKTKVVFPHNFTLRMRCIYACCTITCIRHIIKRRSPTTGFLEVGRHGITYSIHSPGLLGVERRGITASIHLVSWGWGAAVLQHPFTRSPGGGAPRYCSIHSSVTERHALRNTT